MESYLAAIDLGTTSVEISLLRPDGTVAAKHGFLNPWRKYGSDVISRITWQEKHPEQRQVPADEMKRAILPVLDRMLSWQEGRTLSSLRRICITGNAAMTAMFLGLDASCLGKAPFSLPFEKLKELTISGIPCMVPASASAFLGSDSVGGAWSLPLGEDEILMDLGTNGEMLLCHSGEIYGASAACGPAFENCTRSQGIYGSTTISAIAGLIRRGGIAADGTLSEDMVRNGILSNGIRITADILHQIQLAVGALYATFSMLVQRAGMEIKELKRIHLAGGFGFHMSIRDAVEIGLIPYQQRDRIRVAGNTSLLAAERLVTMDDEGTALYDVFRKRIRVFQFAGDPEYEKVFYESMKPGKR